MKVNGQEVKGVEFAFDTCHKIYVCETKNDREAAEGMEYEIYPIESLKYVFYTCCPLRFISNWGLDKHYVRQGENAVFERKRAYKKPR